MLTKIYIYLSAFLVSLVLFILQSCHTGGGCEMNYSNAKSLGDVSFTSESEKWLPELGLDSALFVNSNGAKFFFTINRYKDNNNEYELYLNQDLRGGSCVKRDYNYVSGSIDNYRLICNQVPFYINMDRMLNLNERTYSDTIKLKDIINLSDKINIRIGSNYCEFVLKDSSTYKKSDIIILDSLYHKVYEVSSLRKGYEQVIQTYYFQSGKGLIGFKFSNNEIWARKAY
jgi:hypothetical protein